jgi:hypothetical protein
VGGGGGGSPLPSSMGIAAAAQPAPASAVHVASDPFVRVLYEVGVSPDSTDVRLYLEPTTGALRNLNLQIEAPPTLSMRVSAPPPATVAGARVALPMLSTGGAASVVVSASCSSAPAGPEAVLMGQLSYMDAASGSEPRILSFRLSVGLPTLLRPNPIPTSDFGHMWPSHAAESKTTVVCHQSNAARDTAAFMGVLERKLNISAVQTIGMECIACGRLVGAPALTLLVHGKLGMMNGGALELTLRTRDPRLTDALQRVTTEALQSGV